MAVDGQLAALRLVRGLCYAAIWGFLIAGAPVDAPVVPGYLFASVLFGVAFVAMSVVIARRAWSGPERRLRLQRLAAGSLATAGFAVFSTIPSPDGVFTTTQNVAMTVALISLVAFVVLTIQVRRRFPRTGPRVASAAPIVAVPPAPAPPHASAPPPAPTAAEDERASLEDRLRALELKHPSLRALAEVRRALDGSGPSIAIARLRLVEAERGLARRAEITATLAGTQRRLKGLSTQLAEGTISETAFEAARRHLEGDRSELEDELARLDSALFQEDFEKPV